MVVIRQDKCHMAGPVGVQGAVADRSIAGLSADDFSTGLQTPAQEIMLMIPSDIKASRHEFDSLAFFHLLDKRRSVRHILTEGIVKNVAVIYAAVPSIHLHCDRIEFFFRRILRSVLLRHQVKGFRLCHLVRIHCSLLR